MKVPVLLVTTLLVYGVVSGDAVDSPKSTALPGPEKNNQPQPNGGQNSALSGKASTSEPSGSSTNSTDVKSSNSKTGLNVEKPSSHSDVPDMISDSSMFSRAAYLLTGISVLLLLYFAWRSFSLRKRPTLIHKYGVVASREDLEMTSLGFGSEDEEDDTTHFDIGKHQRS